MVVSRATDFDPNDKTSLKSFLREHSIQTVGDSDQIHGNTLSESSLKSFKTKLSTRISGTESQETSGIIRRFLKFLWAFITSIGDNESTKILKKITGALENGNNGELEGALNELCKDETLKEALVNSLVQEDSGLDIVIWLLENSNEPAVTLRNKLFGANIDIEAYRKHLAAKLIPFAEDGPSALVATKNSKAFEASNKLKDLRSEYKEKLVEVDKKAKDLPEKLSAAEQCKQRYSQLQQEYKEYEMKVNEFQSGLKPAEENCTKLESERNALEKEIDASGKEFSELEKEIENEKKQLNLEKNDLEKKSNELKKEKTVCIEKYNGYDYLRGGFLLESGIGVPKETLDDDVSRARQMLISAICPENVDQVSYSAKSVEQLIKEANKILIDNKLDKEPLAKIKNLSKVLIQAEILRRANEEILVFNGKENQMQTAQSELNEKTSALDKKTATLTQKNNEVQTKIGKFNAVKQQLYAIDENLTSKRTELQKMQVGLAQKKEASEQARQEAENAENQRQQVSDEHGNLLQELKDIKQKISEQEKVVTENMLSFNEQDYSSLKQIFKSDGATDIFVGRLPLLPNAGDLIVAISKELKDSVPDMFFAKIFEKLAAAIDADNLAMNLQTVFNGKSTLQERADFWLEKINKYNCDDQIKQNLTNIFSGAAAEVKAIHEPAEN